MEQFPLRNVCIIKVLSSVSLLPLSSDEDLVESQAATAPFLWKERNKRWLAAAAAHGNHHARDASAAPIPPYPPVQSPLLYFHTWTKIAPSGGAAQIELTKAPSRSPFKS